MVGCQQDVEGGNDEQRKQRTDRQSRRDHKPHVEARGGARARGHDQRYDAEHHGRRCHQDRTQPDRRRLDHCVALRAAGMLQLVGEFDDQDAVLADQSHQRHEADLRVNVETGALDAEHDEDQRARHRHRNRDQDDQRISEALELRCQSQEDDDQREAERGRESTGFLNELPG